MLQGLRRAQQLKAAERAVGLWLSVAMCDVIWEAKCCALSLLSSWPRLGCSQGGPAGVMQ